MDLHFSPEDDRKFTEYVQIYIRDAVTLGRVALGAELGFAADEGFPNDEHVPPDGAVDGTEATWEEDAHGCIVSSLTSVMLGGHVTSWSRGADGPADEC
jgi:hypothetical protein